ncbi:MAG: zinc-dependent alcohol dehydrogenase family protein, partial [Gammaproteobacteria bacterium]
AVHEAYGAPREVLRVVEQDPGDPAEGEVVVRMEAAAMHIADLRTIEGSATFRRPLPRTPGFEGIGRVERAGRDAGFAPGDRVFPPLGSGTFRERLRCRGADCLPAPEGDAVQLALLTVNGPTAAVLLEDFAALQPGDWLVQNAANASCGRYLIRLARLAGVRTVNIVRRPEMVDELLALGGDAVLVDGPDLAAQVRAATGGVAPRLGVDAVAGAATQRIAECLAPQSPLVCYGAMGGAPCEIDFYLMFREGIVLHGLSFVRQLQRRRPDELRALYARLAGLMADGTLAARIAAVYPLDRIVEACEHAARSGAERDGKVIISLV